jgi:glutamate N-acetyltransferase / amino-acid N-acetyltransferase
MSVTAPRGFAASGVHCGIRKAKPDLALVRSLTPATGTAMFTVNRVQAAPVVVSKEHLALAQPQAVALNSGVANAATGLRGELDARATASEAARLLGLYAEEVLVLSTGVIGAPLPLAHVLPGLEDAASALSSEGGSDAAEAIMTTDTQPKAASKRLYMDGAGVTITGIAKGAGMIHPNMATMLAFIVTDAELSQPLLEAAVREACRRSFNRISVDGDTSTNDAFMVIATGRTAAPAITAPVSPEYVVFQQGLTEVAQQLAQAVVRDGEGATKFITVEVRAGSSESECEQVGFAIARSPLVKTAFFASDPNLGRLLAAIGNSGIDDLDVTRIRLYLQGALVAENGGRAAAYSEEQGQAAMRGAEIAVTVELNRGEAAVTLWTCDLSYDYVKINAEYRT